MAAFWILPFGPLDFKAVPFELTGGWGNMAVRNDLGATPMQSTSKLVVAFAVLATTTVAANADWPRSSARQPDFSSCSSARQACTVGTARRGQTSAWCSRAYAACMRTGTWDTYDGMYGRRVSGLARR